MRGCLRSRRRLLGQVAVLANAPDHSARLRRAIPYLDTYPLLPEPLSDREPGDAAADDEYFDVVHEPGLRGVAPPKRRAVSASR
jgi:hypothetical protein